jgi:hypothetical protein
MSFRKSSRGHKTALAVRSETGFFKISMTFRRRSRGRKRISEVVKAGIVFFVRAVWHLGGAAVSKSRNRVLVYDFVLKIIPLQTKVVENKSYLYITLKIYAE